MTDELELLLEEEEEREEQEQELPGLFPVKYRGVRDGRPGEVQAAPGPEEERPETVLRLPRRGAARFEAWEGFAPQTETEPFNRAPGTEGGAAVEVTASPGSPEKTGSAFLRAGTLRQEAAGRFYRALLRSGRAAGYRRAERGESIRVVNRQTTGTPAPDAAALDRLFQRDARRYDGGFTWQ